MKIKFLALSLMSLMSLLFCQISFAAEKVLLMGEDADSFPFSMKDKSGLDFILLNMVDEKLAEIEFEYKLVPWQRCLESIKSNAAQGCFTASFKTKRLAFGSYPMKGDKPDENLRLHSSSYTLYTTKGNEGSVKVNGLDITGLNGMISVTRGYSIGDDLKGKGYKVDATSSKSISSFKKLAAGKVQYVAELSQSGDAIISKFDGKLVAIKPDLITKPYYLMFSNAFIKKNKALTDKIFATIASVRESAEFKKASNDWLNSKK